MGEGRRGRNHWAYRGFFKSGNKDWRELGRDNGIVLLSADFSGGKVEAPVGMKVGIACSRHSSRARGRND